MSAETPMSAGTPITPMRLLAVNGVLSILFASVIAPAVLPGGFSLAALLIGFALGYALLYGALSATGQASPYFRRVIRSIHLALYFLYDLVVSSIAVVWDVLTPTHLSNPKILDMPLDVRSDAEILLVTNLISLTPGTLSLDVSDDRKTLTVHAMFADDPEGTVRSLKNGMERMVREAFE